MPDEGCCGGCGRVAVPLAFAVAVAALAVVPSLLPCDPECRPHHGNVDVIMAPPVMVQGSGDAGIDGSYDDVMESTRTHGGGHSDPHGHGEEAEHSDPHGHSEEAEHSDPHGHGDEAEHSDPHGHGDEAEHSAPPGHGEDAGHSDPPGHGGDAGHSDPPGHGEEAEHAPGPRPVLRRRGFKLQNLGQLLSADGPGPHKATIFYDEEHHGWSLSRHGRGSDPEFSIDSTAVLPPIGTWGRTDGGEGSINVSFDEHDVESITISRVLFIVVFFIFELLYLVNSSDSQMRYYTWRLLGTSTSIFLAVVVNHAIASFLLEQVLAGGGHRGFGVDVNSSNAWSVRVGLLLFVTSTLLQSVLGKAASKAERPKNRKRYLFAVSGLLGHICGFALIRLAGYLQQTFCLDIGAAWAVFLCTLLFSLLSRCFLRQWRSSCLFPPAADACYEAVVRVAGCAGCCAERCWDVACCPLWSLLHCSGTLQRTTTTDSASSAAEHLSSESGGDDGEEDGDIGEPSEEGHGAPDDDDEDWKEDVVEGEDECISMALSFLLTQCLMFHVTGELLPMHGDASYHSWGEVVLALGVCLGLLVLYVLSLLLWRAKGTIDGAAALLSFHNAGHLIKRFQMLLGFTVSWTSLMLIEWTATYFIINPATVQIVVAVFATQWGILAIFVLDKIADQLEAATWKRTVGYELCKNGCQRFVAQKWSCTPELAIGRPWRDGVCCSKCDGTGRHVSGCTAHQSRMLQDLRDSEAKARKAERSQGGVGVQGDASETIRSMVDIVAFLQGIALEKAFHISEDLFVSATPLLAVHPVIAKIGLSVAFFCLVTPLLLAYINPKVLLGVDSHLRKIWAESDDYADARS